MLANGGRSSSGMNSPTSSSRQPLVGADKSKGLLLELGKPGHWSASSLANRRGGLSAFGGLLGLLTAPARRLGGGVALPCRGGRPSASFLRLPLPRDPGWASHASSTRSRRSAASSSNLWLEGCTTQCCAPWQWGTVKSSCLSSGRVVLPPRWAPTPPPGGGRFRVVRLEAVVPSRKEITARLLAN